MITVTNKSDISLEMAVWLLHDEYDYVDEENYISATGLMKPLRHILLPSRIPPADRIVPDVEDYIATAMGTALHAGIEKAWKEGHIRALQRLGIPEAMIKRVLLNPTPEQLELATVGGLNPIPVYLELRSFRKLDGYLIGGKFDMVCDGRVTDTKTTSAWSWVYGGREDDYQLQGSIYRWLNPDKIKEDFIRINFIFTDWDKKMVGTKEEYPSSRVKHKDIPLLSIADTEAWIHDKLSQVTANLKTPEAELPECTDKELWMTAPKFKYYADSNNTAGRSTKNFDDGYEARKFLAEKGKGTIITVPGTPKRCSYCSAFPICTQKDKYTHD